MFIRIFKKKKTLNMNKNIVPTYKEDFLPVTRPKRVNFILSLFRKIATKIAITTKIPKPYKILAKLVSS